MTARLMILNGPNLNLLGIREPHIYGTTTLAEIEKSCQDFAAFAGAQVSCHQSNHEGVLVDLIQAARRDADAIIINPAAYSFTSVAIFDAMKIFEGRSSRCTSRTFTRATNCTAIPSCRRPSRP
jgi:3-dehydroquinate dehydratase-2